MIVFRVILKILLIIVLMILLLLVIVCLSSVAAHVSFWNGKFEWSIRYFGIQILPFRHKKTEKPAGESDENQENKKKKKDKKEKKDSRKSDKKSGKFLIDAVWEKMQKFAEMMDMAGSGMHALPPALRSLGNAITWYAIETDILIADEDAADCARQYGLIQTVLQNLFSQTGNYIHVKRKEISIRYDFIQDKSQYNFRCRVKIHIGKTIGAGIVFLWNYFKDSRKAKTAVVHEKL